MIAGSDKSFWRIAIIVYVVLTAVNYLPVLSGRVPFPRDIVLRHAVWDTPSGSSAPKPSPEISDLINSFYPFHSLVARSFSSGSLPLWNPYILGGTPLEANSQSAPFYPFNFFYYVLPLPLAWTVCIMLRLFFAALFMALLLRSIGGTTTGSILAGIIFSLSGFMTAWQGQGMGDAAIWLPLICYSVIRLHRSIPSSASPSIGLVAISFAMPVLAGHPETAVHLTLTGCALALLLAGIRLKKSRDLQFIACFAVAGILAIGLASIQIVPTLEWFGQLGKFVNRIPPALTRHDGQGFFSRDLLSSPSSALLPIPEAASYLGMLGLMAVPFALFHKSRRWVLFFVCITIAAAAVAFSVEPAHWIATKLPIVSSMKNGRLILIATFGIAALAGLGISALEQETVNRSFRNRTRALVLMGITFLVALGGIYEVHRATLVPVDFMRGPWGSLLFLTAAAGFLLWKVNGRTPGRSFSVLICILAGIELLSFSFGYTGFAKLSEIFPSAPAYEFLQSRGDPSTFRIAKTGYPIPANSGILYGLESAEGYEIPAERTKIFNSGLTETRDDAVFYEAERVVQSTDRRLDMLNVKYWIVIAASPQFREFAKRPEKFELVFQERSIVIFENKSVLPRLIAIPQSGMEIIPDEDAQVARIQDPQFTPDRSVILSKSPADLRLEDNRASSLNSDLQLIRSDMNSYEFHTRTSAQAVLVLSQIYYPGWKASVDGSEVPVYPVNYALTGILAPGGEHTVEFYFQPRSFQIGTALSLISLCVIVGLFRPLSAWKRVQAHSCMQDGVRMP